MVVLYKEFFDGYATINPATENIAAINTTDDNTIEDNTVADKLNELPPKKGLIMLTDTTGKPFLLLMTSNIRKIARQRLIPPDKNKKYHTPLTQVTSKIWFRYCYSDFETKLQYMLLAQNLFPADYRNFFKHLDIWFLSIDPQQKYPAFLITNKYQPDKRIYWGPFLQRTKADNLLTQILDSFNLCRQPATLSHAPNAKPCVYAQIGSCLPACDGTVSAQRYHEAIDQAINFLDKLDIKNNTRNNSVLNDQTSNAKVAFNKSKQKLLNLIESDTYRCIMPVKKFQFLVFKPGPVQKLPTGKRKTQLISPFIIMPGQVKQLEPFAPEQIDKASKDLLNHFYLMNMQRDNQIHKLNQPEYELWAWTTQVMCKDKNKKGLYIPIDKNTHSNHIADQLRTHFPSAGR